MSPNKLIGIGVALIERLEGYERVHQLKRCATLATRRSLNDMRLTGEEEVPMSQRNNLRRACVFVVMFLSVPGAQWSGGTRWRRRV